MLSLRHRYEDVFWFSFFHELGHVLLHKHLYINTDPVDGEQKSDIEQEADRLRLIRSFRRVLAEQRGLIKCSRTVYHGLQNKSSVSWNRSRKTSA